MIFMAREARCNFYAASCAIFAVDEGRLRLLLSGGSSIKKPVCVLFGEELG